MAEGAGHLVSYAANTAEEHALSLIERDTNPVQLYQPIDAQRTLLSLMQFALSHANAMIPGLQGADLFLIVLGNMLVARAHEQRLDQAITVTATTVLHYDPTRNIRHLQFRIESSILQPDGSAIAATTLGVVHLSEAQLRELQERQHHRAQVVIMQPGGGAAMGTRTAPSRTNNALTIEDVTDTGEAPTPG